MTSVPGLPLHELLGVLDSIVASSISMFEALILDHVS